MTPQDLLDYYSTQAAIAKAANLKPQSVQEWFVKGEVPIDRQCQFEVITAGDLIADREQLPEIPPHVKQARA